MKISKYFKNRRVKFYFKKRMEMVTSIIWEGYKDKELTKEQIEQLPMNSVYDTICDSLNEAITRNLELSIAKLEKEKRQLTGQAETAPFQDPPLGINAVIGNSFSNKGE